MFKSLKLSRLNFKIRLSPCAPKLQVMDFITLNHQICWDPTQFTTTIYVISVSQFKRLLSLRLTYQTTTAIARMEINNSRESKVPKMLTNIYLNWILISSAKEDHPGQLGTRVNSLFFPGWWTLYLHNTRGQFGDGWYNIYNNNNLLHRNVNNYYWENCQDMFYHRGTSLSQNLSPR